MMRSLFAGVSALRNHQIRMDVIANNIANVNTIGFKASRVTFQDLLSQQLRDASAPQGNRGGTNPMQVGLGSSLATINVNHGQGNLETTGVETDLAIEGSGYFVVGDGLQRYYTRAGMLALDRQGNVVLDGTGLKVYGWMADLNGNIDTNATPTALSIPINATIDPRATTRIFYAGNLDSRTTGTLSVEPFTVTNGTDTAQITIKFTPTGNFNEFRWEVTTSNGTISPASGTVTIDAAGVPTWTPAGPIAVTLPSGTVNIDLPATNALEFQVGGTPVATGTFTPAPERATPIMVFDSLGNAHEILMRFVKTGNNTWEWQAEDAFGNPLGSGDITFDASGRLIGSTGTITFTPPGGAAAPMTIQPDFSSLVQVAEPTTAQAVEQDGYPAGSFKDLSIDDRGVIIGTFSNGLTRAIGQIALANFANPAGLARAGSNLFVVTNNSGDPLIGTAGSGHLGKISSSSLEMSNVDLSQEFTNMILTQRGFQANSRIITTSDEMLQELVNLKR